MRVVLPANTAEKALDEIFFDFNDRLMLQYASRVDEKSRNIYPGFVEITIISRRSLHCEIARDFFVHLTD